MSSSVAGAYDPVFIRTNVLPQSDQQHLADKVRYDDGARVRRGCGFGELTLFPFFSCVART